MNLNNRIKTVLAGLLFGLFIVSVVYNLSRDPRSLYKPEERPRKILLEQERKRQPVKKTTGESEPLLKVNLLDNSAVRYRSEMGRNIFTLEEPPVKLTDQTQKTEMKNEPAPAITQPEPIRIEKPFTFVGFAETGSRNYAILLEKKTARMIIAYPGLDLGNGYGVKMIERKKVVIFDNNAKQEIEITISE